jgi:iron(III) transport system substrate-binding protein
MFCRSRLVFMVLVTVFLQFGGAYAQSQLSSAERLYAELAKLPANERQARLIEGAKKEGQLDVYTGLKGQMAGDYLKLFTDAYPFVKVRKSEFGNDDMVTNFEAEETASRHLTDVLTSLAVASAVDLIDKNMVARYPTPVTDRILPQYRPFVDPENRWLPEQLSEHGLAYNTSMLRPDEAPKSWDDLCKPQYSGQESFDPAESTFLIGMYYIFGKDMNRLHNWLDCIGKNKPIIMRGHDVRLNLMLSGDHAILADTYLYEGTRRNRQDPVGAPFKTVYSAEVMGWCNATFINRNTAHPYTAALYTDWVLSVPPQQFLSNVLRGPVILKHPFLPDDVKLVVFDRVDKATLNQLYAAWDKYIGPIR